ncbi:MAG: HAD family hydrolase [Verrucomicrobiota bacterium]
MSAGAEPIRLVCTDFDGTLANAADAGPIPRRFFDKLTDYRKQRCKELTWVIATGRSWEDLSELMERRAFPLWPNWVILVEREIWMVRKRRPVGWYEWNRRSELVHDQLFETVGPLWSKVESFVRDQTKAEIVKDHGSPMGIEASSPDEADAIDAYLESVVAVWPNLRVVRNQTYFRFSHRNYNKGSCLRSISHGLLVPPEQILAIGDSFNDVPMLNREIATRVAAPANAVELVREQVQSQGGYVAGQAGLAGVEEAWDHYTQSD